ncbi:jg19719, partial [Pararge aegeria aegeria]
MNCHRAHQDVFPRSYQYDLDCVKYRRQHACDGLKQTLNFQ